LDWHYVAGTPFEAKNSTVAWTGSNRHTTNSNDRRSLRLFKSVITPSRSEVSIDSIDFVSAATESSPFLVAVTLDRNADPLELYHESNERALANYASNPDNDIFLAELVSSWQHLAKITSEPELASAYKQLAFGFATSRARSARQVSSEFDVPSERLTVVVPAGELDWRYWDRGSRPDPEWYATTYDDSGWGSGQAPLGYNESGLSTTIGFGDDANNKHPTTYFRKTFSLTNPADLYRLTLSADDGAAVYVNGKRVFNTNLREDANDRSFARSVIPEPLVPSVWWVPAEYFNTGENTLGIEVHQVSRTSSDVYFDLQVQAINTDVDYDQIEATLSEHAKPLPPAIRRLQSVRPQSR
jgi:hypothetical protein